MCFALSTFFSLLVSFFLPLHNVLLGFKDSPDTPDYESGVLGLGVRRAWTGSPDTLDSQF